MEQSEKILDGKNSDEDLGFLLWQLEELENFYPCYKSMTKKE